MNAQFQSSTPGSVLVVDDDPEVRVLLQRWLADGPYEIRMAENADGALAECTARPADVIICDVMMPGRDGLWLADQVRRGSPGTLIIFGTAVDDLPAMSTLRPGVAGYLVKPFRRAQVCAAVDQALALASTARQAPRAARVPLVQPR